MHMLFGLLALRARIVSGVRSAGAVTMGDCAPASGASGPPTEQHLISMGISSLIDPVNHESIWSPFAPGSISQCAG